MLMDIGVPVIAGARTGSQNAPGVSVCYTPPMRLLSNYFCPLLQDVPEIRFGAVARCKKTTLPQQGRLGE